MAIFGESEVLAHGKDEGGEPLVETVWLLLECVVLWPGELWAY